MNEALEAAVKQEMRYKENAPACCTCAHYMAADCSGEHNALPAHCKRNAFPIRVSDNGCCDFWTQKLMQTKNKADDRKGTATLRVK